MSSLDRSLGYCHTQTGAVGLLDAVLLNDCGGARWFGQVCRVASRHLWPIGGSASALLCAVSKQMSSAPPDHDQLSMSSGCLILLGGHDLYAFSRSFLASGGGVTPRSSTSKLCWSSFESLCAQLVTISSVPDVSKRRSPDCLRQVSAHHRIIHSETPSWSCAE